jgi:hypothetical protein
MNSQDGITFNDLQAFTQLLESISDIEMALGMYMAAGASITAGIIRFYNNWLHWNMLTGPKNDDYSF